MIAEPEFEVVAAAQHGRNESCSANPRPNDLANMTIGFVWDYLFEGPVFFDAIRNLVDSRFPGVRYVGHESFGNISWAQPTEMAEDLPARLRAAGVDLAVVAVGA
jgi:hypothetical protein